MKEERKVQIHSIIELVRKWLWLIILACLLGGAAGYIVSHFQPKIYEAQTTLYLSTVGQSDNQTILGDQQAANAFANLPLTGPVLLATLKAVGDSSLNPTQLSSMITVSNTLGSQFVVIKVRDRDPHRAALLATELSRTSIAQFEAAAMGNDQAKQFVNLKKDMLEKEINNLDQEINNMQSQANPNTNLLNQLKASRDEELSLYTQLLATETNMSNIQVTILQEAEIPQKPVSPVTALAVALGILVGLITIVGVIILIEQSNNILLTPAKVYAATGLLTLITVNRQPAIEKRLPSLSTRDHELARYHEDEEVTYGRLPISVATQTLAPVSKSKGLHKFQLPEEFLTLGVLLRGERSQLAARTNDMKTLLITSPEEEDGKTLIASEIALGLARTGVEIILVDANLRNPQVHKIFGLSNSLGLRSVLMSSYIDYRESPTIDMIFETLQNTSEPNLVVLPAGPVTDSPSELLSSPAMTTIINQLSQKAFVVIDSPSVLSSSDAVILANKSDGILIVVDARSTTDSKLSQSIEILNRINENTLGVVLNHV